MGTSLESMEGREKPTSMLELENDGEVSFDEIVSSKDHYKRYKTKNGEEVSVKVLLWENKSRIEFKLLYNPFTEKDPHIHFNVDMDTESDGRKVLKMDVDTKGLSDTSHKNIHAGVIADNVIQYLQKRYDNTITALHFDWTTLNKDGKPSDNLKTFQEYAVKYREEYETLGNSPVDAEEMAEEDAAFETWTGKIARRNGFKKIRITKGGLGSRRAIGEFYKNDADLSKE